MEWRDIQRVTETECVQSIEVDIFCLRHWPIEVSPDNFALGFLPSLLHKLLTHAYSTGSQLALQGGGLWPKVNIGFT